MTEAPPCPSGLDRTECRVQGQVIPQDLLGELRETAFDREQGDVLRQRLEEDGYLLLRRITAEDLVRAAREEVFGRLAEVGEIRQPVVEGIATGTSRRREMVADLGKFWQSVSEGPALRRVSHGVAIQQVMDTVLGEPARAQDYIFLRPSVPGRATNLHYDFPFFARGSSRIYTVWTAIGAIAACEGPLVVVEGSHHFRDLIDPVLQIDYSSPGSGQVSITSSAIELARERKSRLLTTAFQPGDVLIFGMTILHGSLDNHSPIGRARLSSDVRWQPASDPIDPRYVGPNPPGTTGAGYGELNGAKPLDVPWHVR